MPKQLIYKNEGGQIETYDLTDEKAEEINNFLSSGNRATHFEWNGQSFMAKNARIRKKSIPQIEVKRGYDLNNPVEREIIEDFEKVLMQEWVDNVGSWQFTDYLVKMDAIRIDSGTVNEIVKNPKLYTELSKKWNALGELRNLREKAKKLGKELVKVKPKTEEEGVSLEKIPF